MVHLLALVVPICGILGLDPCPDNACAALRDYRRQRAAYGS